ncbi:hypothetical protein [Haloferax volcanii]|uniref:hypothetical protein n=1 Tax=Haloferax volcanii TaxID=2246 RepID=UPI003D30316D
MDRDIRRNFEDLVRDAEHQSDKALYPYLKLHIFGPYHGDCYAYLTELKSELQSRGFFEASICDDRGNEPPSDATRDERSEFFWKESEDFLIEADVGVFVFLDHVFQRENLSDRSRKQAHDIKGTNPTEINSSVVGELFHWLGRIDENHERTLLLFEEGIYEELGSVVTGRVQATGVDYEKIPNEDIESAVSEVRQRSTNWVMNELRDDLVKRYEEERLG